MKRVALLLLVALTGCGSSSSSSSSSASAIVMSPVNGSTLPDATIGVPYSETFNIVSGGTAPYALIAQGTPGGLTFAAVSSYSGTLSGTPTQTGQGTFALEIIDASNTTTQLSYTLTIKNPTTATLTVSPATAPNGTVGAAYAQTLVISGGTAPYGWSVSSGSLPPGLSLGSSTSSSNTLSGTPTTSGTYSFTISVSDASATVERGSVTFTVTIS